MFYIKSLLNILKNDIDNLSYLCRYCNILFSRFLRI
ncbi:HNH endonuclease [Gemella sanguinis]